MDYVLEILILYFFLIRQVVILPIDLSQRHVLRHELLVVAQLEVEDLDAGGPRVNLLNVFVEELHGPKRPMIPQRLFSDFLWQMSLLHEVQTGPVVARQVLQVVIVVLVQVGVDAFHVLLVVDKLLNVPLVLIQAKRSLDVLLVSLSLYHLDILASVHGLQLIVGTISVLLLLGPR